MNNYNNSYKKEILKLWDQWTELHLNSSFYNTRSVIEGKDTLTGIELAELGDLKGLSVLHLQCHFGLDSISLARKGANVTGVDMSERSISEARKLANLCDLSIRFICSDVYDLDKMDIGKFDMVFTSYGVLGWLPDLEKWGNIIFRLLNKNGILYLAEFHPLYFMLDEKQNRLIRYPWDSNGVPLKFMNVSSYAEPDIPLKNTEFNWAHGLGTIVNSIVNSGLTMRFLHEYDYCPYPLSDDMIKEIDGKWRLKEVGDLIPYVFTIKATKS
jgi:2-polyprenyl-3-methyl-5-hydroxy-6-metoxy-1,4-benzoquinol methylase